MRLEGAYEVIHSTPHRTVLAGENNHIVLKDGEYLIFSNEELQSLYDTATSNPDGFWVAWQELIDIKADLVRRSCS
jgi:hypothetical protein